MVGRPNGHEIVKIVDADWQKPGAASRSVELASAVGALAAGLAVRPAAVPPLKVASLNLLILSYFLILI